ncbi:flavin-containing monooxygenase [Aeromicrobium wangtongii]|uniref:NAD(P)/FAD-dependent oxidoreductase n=1 Tax=Aeromicrobium wangtongii TaxID=2969247 RepID=A0ABY5MBK0_9ACTN|nr:NAD(P)/FAD-dependent oxidoreductase [Aeromicrobium wangtongii]MCD9196979.1 NAD(P)/FAD-dependent oxidoreductase [Aeromicrobium wangtongii]UUP14481.1 NAD(P)/FAD-dependent oxidoreductase [Aeromicrobium wangtongii]
MSMTDTGRRRDKASSGAPWPRICIVGGGLGGIGTAVKLRQAGYEQFTIFESSSGPGGTWHTNRYPGCEVDTSSKGYSFSFMDYPWSSTHARQPELLGYAEAMIERFNLRDRFRFNTRVVEARWDDGRGAYSVILESGETLEFDVLVSAVGMFALPNIPQWPGMESFGGEMFHSSQWPESIDLSGKRVAVVGTGSTASQIVPEVAQVAETVKVFQRQPGWILPKPVRTFDDAEKRRIGRRRLRRKARRALMFWEYGVAAKGFTVGSRQHRKMTGIALEYLDSAVTDPVIRQALTPSYPFGCKRPIKTSGFLESFNRSDVELVAQSVTAVSPSGLIDSAGKEHPLDAVIIATGFHASKYLATLPVYGLDGVELQEAWDGDPQAFLGITVPRFPNLFILYGPNTNGGGPITSQIERQIEFTVRAIRRAEKLGRHTILTDPSALTSFVAEVDQLNAQVQSAADAGCNNYYVSESGRNVTQWPTSHLRYILALRRGFGRLRFQ